MYSFQYGHDLFFKYFNLYVFFLFIFDTLVFRPNYNNITYDVTHVKYLYVYLIVRFFLYLYRSFSFQRVYKNIKQYYCLSEFVQIIINIILYYVLFSYFQFLCKHITLKSVLLLFFMA